MKASVCCVYFYNTVVSCILVLLSGLAKAYKSLTWFRAKCILRIPLHKTFQKYWKLWCSKICYPLYPTTYILSFVFHFMIWISYQKGQLKLDVSGWFSSISHKNINLLYNNHILIGEYCRKRLYWPYCSFLVAFPLLCRSSSALSKNDCFCKLTQQYISDKGAEGI